MKVRWQTFASATRDVGLLGRNCSVFFLLAEELSALLDVFLLEDVLQARVQLRLRDPASLDGIAKVMLLEVNALCAEGLHEFF